MGGGENFLAYLRPGDREEISPGGHDTGGGDLYIASNVLLRESLVHTRIIKTRVDRKRASQCIARSALRDVCVRLSS